MGWALDMGQWLSIPFILLGIYMIWRGFRARLLRCLFRRSRSRRGRSRKSPKNGNDEQQSLEEQVGRIVGNVLAAGGAIYLPEVGSLCVERRRAQQLSRRTVRPPYRAVEFTSQQRGVSLVEEIARVLRNERHGGPMKPGKRPVRSMPAGWGVPAKGYADRLGWVCCDSSTSPSTRLSTVG